ncbi:MAG: ribosome maturation factor RimP [Bdellovibrionota bacterium]
MNGSFLTEIRKLAEEVSAREGCVLWDLELTGSGSGRILRVTIDKDIEGGVTITDCTNVSRGLNEVLDTSDDAVPGGQYYLEVSSPGLERVLKEPRHYERAVGQRIQVKTFAPLLQFNEEVPDLGKAKQITGKLLSYDDKGLKIAYEGIPGQKPVELAEGEEPRPVFVPFETVTKAHVVFEFEESAVKKPGGPKKNDHKAGHKK